MSTLTLDDLKGSFTTNNKKKYYYRAEYEIKLENVICTVYYGTNSTCNSTYSIESIGYTPDTYSYIDNVVKSIVLHRKDELLTQLNNSQTRLLKTGYNDIYKIGNVCYLLTVTQTTTTTRLNTYMSIDNINYKSTISKTLTSSDDIEELQKDIVSSCMLELKDVCNSTPIDIDELFSVDDCYFKLDVKHIKDPCDTKAFVKVYMDENLYKESQITISSNEDIANDIQNLKLTGNFNFNKLKEAINAIPVTNTEVYTIDNISFRIKTILFKKILDGIVRYEVQCDGTKYAEGIADLTVSTLSTVADDVKSNTDSIIETIKKFISAIVPKNNIERFRSNSLWYLLGYKYIKNPNDTTLTLYITIDGEIFFTKVLTLSFETLKTDSDNVISIKDTELESIKEIIRNNTLVDTSYLRSVNNFTYTISIQYVKDPGSEIISLEILVDGRVYHSYTYNINISTLSSNINSIKEYCNTRISNLYQILDQSPEDTKDDTFLIDNFEYTGGASYSKNEGNPSVIVKLYIQGKLKKTLTYNLYAEKLQSNMNTLKSGTNNNLTKLKNSLYSIAPTEETYNIDSCYFKIMITYDKTETSNYVKVTPTLDGEPIGDPVPIVFSKTKTTFTNKGNELISVIKDKLIANTPRTNIGNYTVNGFTYYTGYKFTKSANSSDVVISTLIDGVEVGESKTLEYTIDNGDVLLDTAIAMFYKIRDKLDKDTPKDYNKVMSIHGFYFALGSTFTKQANSNQVTIKTMMDGSLYKTTVFGSYSIYDVQSLLNKAESEENKIVDILVNVPSNIQKIWSYDNRFYFLVDIVFEKDPNSNEIRSKLLIDKELHGEVLKSIFSINNISSISTAILTEAEKVEEYYATIIPNSVRRLYSKNGYHFAVDSYFSKKAGSTQMLIKIVVTYLDKDVEDMTIILTTSLKSQLLKNVVNNNYTLNI